MMLTVAGAHPLFPPLQKARIENLACAEPSALGLEVTHWSSQTLAQVAVQQGIVTTIHRTTVTLILRKAELQPHRSRYWKSTVWDEEAVAQAAQVLWCYERVDWLWERQEVVLCLDEKPGIQVLERAAPTQGMLPGQIERQEFEYHRHGTVNLLAGLVVYHGRMYGEILERNNGEHFRPAAQRFLAGFSWAKKIHLIIDQGPSHTSWETREFFKDLAPWVRVLYTPKRASWLDQAELLLRCFVERYLKRGSGASREEMILHLQRSFIEYNLRFAHPFVWSWTRRDFRAWLAKKVEESKP
ncbi:MAG: IS630 family transposase [Acidobacteria bacterium]|nr:IS630 family transposase [Acidobacteriota bacterium]